MEWRQLLYSYEAFMSTYYLSLYLQMGANERQSVSEKKLTVRSAVEVIYGTLLGQPLSFRLPKYSSLRIMMGTWLVFAFIMGTAYRGNLTASLTFP